MISQLDALKEYTTVVADTGDIDTIKQFTPEDATTNPSLILKAAQLPQYQPLIAAAIDVATLSDGTIAEQVKIASDHIAINIGIEILKQIPGRVSTEIDVRLSFDRDACITKAQQLIALYEKAGISRKRILTKIAATWEGIQAARQLEQEGINCNLTLLFSFAQAQACAEAGVFLISPFVGRIYDWYQLKQPVSSYYPDKDPGVISVRHIYDYYKQHDYHTIVMGASFRNTEQVLALAGCDKLTISPALLNVLQESQEPVERKLRPALKVIPPPPPLTESDFHWQHNNDEMAVIKLAEGIRLFALDQQKLEDMIVKML